VESEDGTAYPPLSLAALYLQFGRDPLAAPADADELDLFGRAVPLEAEESMRVNYVGGADRFPRIPFGSVVDGSFDPAMVRDKIVLVGVTASGVDRHSTPLLGNAAGIEIHANALDTMLRARFLRPVNIWYVAAVAVALGAVPALTVPRWNIALATLVSALAGVAYMFASVIAFYQGHLLDPVHPPAALLLAIMVGLVHRVMSERASQRDVVDLFGRHVSQEVAHELVDRLDRGDLHLGGELREVTVMFCDVRGYTTMSQVTDPAELVRLLNVCFEAIISSVVEQGGIVNKFVGDAVMAFWNAPQDLPDHAYLACRAAGDAIKKLAAVAQDGPELRWGFGINTGPAIAGNVGSSRRFEYTLMGEAVNTASRLSGVAGGGEAWIGERTHELLAGRYQCDELPPQNLKGMAASVAAYRLGAPAHAMPQLRSLRSVEVVQS
jgi:adenylate cyclase